MVRFKRFTGGVLETHGYLVEAPAGNILIDAPEGAAEYFNRQQIHLLLLTHGHYDHITDAAKIQQQHRCQVGVHRDSAPMLTDRDFFKKWGFELEIKPLNPDFFVEETTHLDLLGVCFQVLLVPGHCPGSLCFHIPADKLLFGGDVLFREGVGRWDLPGGSRITLLEGIHQKLLNLPPDTRVYPGHGPSTTIAHERDNNPYLEPI